MPFLVRGGKNAPFDYNPSILSDQSSICYQFWDRLYLLRGVKVDHVNQVWSTDITYIRLKGGFAYLCAVIDWYSRCVLSWRLSTSLDSSFCVDALMEALTKYGSPSIFNTDQGCQFTSEEFTAVLRE